MNVFISGTLTISNYIYYISGPIISPINLQWQSSNTIDSSFNNISGATLSSYLLVQNDVNKFIKVNISYKDASNNDYSFDSNIVGPINNFITPPINNYNNSIILSQNEVGHYIKLKVTYTDKYGALNTVCSNIVGPVITNNSLPTGILTISGLYSEGRTLVILGTISDSDGISGPLKYQWQSTDTSNGTMANISGATLSTFTLTSNQLGSYIRVLVNYTDNKNTNETVISNNIVGPITPLVNNYNSSLLLTPDEVGYYIKLQVTYTDKYGTFTTVCSNILGPVTTINSFPTGVLTISGLYAQDETLVILGTISDSDGISGQFKYQWQSSDTSNGIMTDISGATLSSFILTSNQVNKFIRVIVRYTDNKNTNETVISNNVVGPITTPIESLILTNITSLSGIISYEWQQPVTVSGFTNKLITPCYDYILTQSLLNNIFNVEVKYINAITKAESKLNKKIGPFNIINTISDMVINANLISSQSLNINGLFDNLNYQWYQLLSSTGTFGCKTKSINTLLTLTEEQNVKLIKLKISMEI